MAAPPDCEVLAARAGAEAGVPEGVLAAIARVEAGRGIGGGQRRAWPWTLNQGGDGSFHPDKATALAKAETLIAQGVRNLDLGCMQLNWRWHAAAFTGADEMLDPVANTRYAALFLAELARRNGSWERAVALYHSSDPARGTAYAGKVAAALAEVLTEAGRPDAAALALAAAPPAQTAALSPADGEAVRARAAARVAGILALSRGPIIAAGAARDLRQVRAPGFGLGPLSRAAQRK